MISVGPWTKLLISKLIYEIYVIMASSPMVHSDASQKIDDLLPTIESSLPPGNFELTLAIAEKASSLGMHIYLVGGPVRDILMGTPVNDFDMVVEGNAALLASVVSKETGGEVVSYSQFGTATVKQGDLRFDLVTARQETYARPGALPTVVPSTIQEDLARRDFSINAMAVPLSGPKVGQLLDLHEGQKDLGKGLIRVLHTISFVDDPTRILRAIRYEQRFGFQLEDRTHSALLEGVDNRVFDTISGDRIRREILLMFKEQNPVLPLVRAGELGVLKAIFAPLGDGSSVKALEAYTGTPDPLLFLAGLVHPLGPVEGESLAARLNMPSSWTMVVRDTIALRDYCTEEDIGRSSGGNLRVPLGQLTSHLDQFCPTSIIANALLTELPGVREVLELYLSKLKQIKTSLNGKDLISLGVAEGPRVGQILGELRNARIEGNIAGREDELAMVREILTKKGD